MSRRFDCPDCGTHQTLKVALQRVVELQNEVASEKERYNRDVHGVNNEGDPIGGVPGGYIYEIAFLKQKIKQLESDVAEYKAALSDFDSHPDFR